MGMPIAVAVLTIPCSLVVKMIYCHSYIPVKDTNKVEKRQLSLSRNISRNV